jgi:hypothetical protein
MKSSTSASSWAVVIPGLISRPTMSSAPATTAPARRMISISSLVFGMIIFRVIEVAKIQ